MLSQSVSAGVTLQPIHSRSIHSGRLGEPPGSTPPAFLKDSSTPSFPSPVAAVTSWSHLSHCFINLAQAMRGEWVASVTWIWDILMVKASQISSKHLLFQHLPFTLDHEFSNFLKLTAEPFVQRNSTREQLSNFFLTARTTKSWLISHPFSMYPVQ